MEKKMTNRQMQAKETKDRILSVASGLLLEKEYDEISIAEIAEKAGISVGAIYHHFSSKEELVFSGYASFDNRLKEYVDSQRFSSYLDAIRNVIRFQTESANRDGARFRAKEIRVQLSTHSKYLLDPDRFLHTYLRQLVDAAIREGELREDCDADEIVSMILRMVRGDLFDWALRLSDEPAEVKPMKDLEVILAYFKKANR